MAHAPYLMPDGRSLASVLRAEKQVTSRESQHKGRGKGGNGKEELWRQLTATKNSTTSEAELAEVQAIQRVGHRRRRQWLNEKLLRDLAGPMTVSDMASQFNPAPFGSYPPPSAFTLAAEQSALWDGFRSISVETESKVLERWEAHNQQERQQLKASSSSRSGGEVRSAHQQQQEAAAAAIRKWGCVSKQARAALKKAPVHTLLELEMQVLQLLEQDSPQAELLLDPEDAFGRLLVHGLAQFNGLLSATRDANGVKHVVVTRRSSVAAQQASSSIQGEQPQQPSQQQPQQQAAGAAHQQQPDNEAARGGGGAASWLLHHADVTCTDVVMAIAELGVVDAGRLNEYMRTVHGTASYAHSAAADEEYVLV